MKFTNWPAAILCGVALVLPALAQEDTKPKEPAPPAEPPAETAPPAAVPAPKKADFGDPPLHRWGGWTISVAGWQPALIGADEELAATYTTGIAYPLMGGSTTRTRETVGAIYHLPKDLGAISAQYDSMNHNDYIENLTPGQFIFGETRAFPVSRGVFDDGLADGYTSTLGRKTREFRLEYTRTAFEGPRAKGTWGFGYRELSHSRDVTISYLALVPNFPPLIPPVADAATAARLRPLSDQVTQTANYTGHGLGATFDVRFPVHPRVSILTGVALGLIRGNAKSAYASVTSFYSLATAPGVPLTKDELFAILANPCAPGESGCDRPAIADVQQEVVVAGLTQYPTSQMAETIDLYIGLEVWAWKGLKVYGLLRDSYYANVGEYVVPHIDLSDTRTPLSAAYEGYALGLSWRF
jgi:hypothetical protein